MLAVNAVVVLNTTYTPLHRVSVQHAISMLYRGVAIAIEEGPEQYGPFLRPKVLLLVRYVRESWKYVKRKRGKEKLSDTHVKVTWESFADPVAPYSVAGVIKRDHGQCAYCGQPTATTMDHVIPKAQGGTGCWENAVAACFDCNQRKADRTPEQAGMPLLWQPFSPTEYDLSWSR